MNQSDSSKDQQAYQDFSSQIFDNQSNYYSYYNYYYGNEHNYQQYAYQYPQCHYGEYNYINSYRYPYSSSYTNSQYQENSLSTSLDSTGNSLNSSNYQTLSPNSSKYSEVSFTTIEKKSTKLVSRKQQLPDNAVDIMNDWFLDHLNNPYPTLEDKERMAKQGRITVKQVTAWFSNRRNRSQNTKPKRIKRAIEQEMNQIISEFSFNPDKTQVIEKFRKTFLSQ